MESERDIENKYAKQLYVWQRGILGLKGGAKPPNEVIEYLNKEIPDWQEQDYGFENTKRVCANHCSNVFVEVKRCAKCKKVYHCSRECQKMDYKRHKLECK